MFLRNITIFFFRKSTIGGNVVLEKTEKIYSVFLLKLLVKYTISLFINPKFLLRKTNVIPWDPNVQKVEIELTSYCTLACHNCNRSVPQAPCQEYVTVEQIKKFVDESISKKWRWKSIGLTGGEPTLHPYFFDVIDVLQRYKEFHPRCRVILFTNGYRKDLQHILSRLPEWITVLNSEKVSNSNKFCSYNVAPIDLDEFKDKEFSQGCRIVDYCGLGFSRYGFYPCGPGASLDRVFGFDIGLKNLQLVDEKNLREQLTTLCKYCGHFKDNYRSEVVSEEMISSTWTKAYEEYESQKPSLILY
jgi:hypothetical protein